MWASLQSQIDKNHVQINSFGNIRCDIPSSQLQIEGKYEMLFDSLLKPLMRWIVSLFLSPFSLRIYYLLIAIGKFKGKVLH